MLLSSWRNYFEFYFRNGNSNICVFSNSFEEPVSHVREVYFRNGNSNKFTIDYFCRWSRYNKKQLFSNDELTQILFKKVFDKTKKIKSLSERYSTTLVSQVSLFINLKFFPGKNNIRFQNHFIKTFQTSYPWYYLLWLVLF